MSQSPSHDHPAESEDQLTLQRYRSGYCADTVRLFAGDDREVEHVGALGSAFGITMPDGSTFVSTDCFGVFSEPEPGFEHERGHAGCEFVGFAWGFETRLVDSLIAAGCWARANDGPPAPDTGTRLYPGNEVPLFFLDGGVYGFDTDVPRLLVVPATAEEYVRWEERGERPTRILGLEDWPRPFKALPPRLIDRWGGR